MGKRQFPWQMRPVPWSDLEEFTRGTWEGLPLMSWGIAPRAKLATRRQLRAMGLRPGGQDPVALLYFRHRAAHKQVLAELFLVERAKPVRPMTPAKQAALDKAMAARRTCRQCGHEGVAELPRSRRVCDPCRLALGEADPWEELHEYPRGEPTLTAAEHAALDAQQAEAGPLAPVLPLRARADCSWRAVAVGVVA